MSDTYNSFSAEAEETRRQQPVRVRVFAFVRFLFFAGLFYVLLQVFGRLMAGFSAKLQTLYWSALAGNLQVLAAAAVTTAVLARMDRKPFGYYGLGKSPCGRRFGFGALTGFAGLTLLLCVMKVAGVFEFGMAMEHGKELATFALIYATLFFVVGLSEEMLFRGYALVSLTEAINFWPAAIVLAILFGATHAKHGGESAAGLVFAGLFAIVLAYTFKRTGSLWFAIGLHAAWDFAESFVYGVPDSGVIVPGRWLSPAVHGPAWLTGGSAGPEGSYLMVLVFVGIVLAVRWLFPEAKSAG